MTYLKSALIGASLILSAPAAHAAVLQAAGNAEGAMGNQVLFVTETNIRSTQVSIGTAGILESYTSWYETTNADFFMTSDLTLSLYGALSTDLLATETFTSAFVQDQPVITGSGGTGGNNTQFFELVWDLSSFNIAADIGQMFEVDHQLTGTGTYRLSAFDNQPAFSLMVNTTDPLASIPLPAGLPLLLAGLGAFGLIRRRA